MITDLNRCSMLSIDTAIVIIPRNMRSRNVMLYLCHKRKGDERETHDDNNCRTRRGKSQLCLGSPFLVQKARKPRDIVKVPDRATTVVGVSVDQTWKSGRNGIKKNGETRYRVCLMVGGRLDKLGFSRLRCRQATLVQSARLKDSLVSFSRLTIELEKFSCRSMSWKFLTYLIWLKYGDREFVINCRNLCI